MIKPSSAPSLYVIPLITHKTGKLALLWYPQLMVTLLSLQTVTFSGGVTIVTTGYTYTHCQVYLSHVGMYTCICTYKYIYTYMYIRVVYRIYLSQCMNRLKELTVL